MPTPWETVQTALYDWAADVLANVPVIWANQNGPRPARPYVALRVTAITPTGHDGYTEIDGEGDRELYGHRDLSIDAQAFSAPGVNLAPTYLSALRLSLGRQCVKDAFEAAGIAIVDALPLLDLSLLRNPEFEGRAQMPFRFRIVEAMEDTPGWVDAVAIDAEFEGRGEMPIEHEFTIGTPYVEPEPEPDPDP